MNRPIRQASPPARLGARLARRRAASEAREERGATLRRLLGELRATGALYPLLWFALPLLIVIVGTLLLD